MGHIESTRCGLKEFRFLQSGVVVLSSLGFCMYCDPSAVSESVIRQCVPYRCHLSVRMLGLRPI